MINHPLSRTAVLLVLLLLLGLAWAVVRWAPLGAGSHGPARPASASESLTEALDRSLGRRTPAGAASGTPAPVPGPALAMRPLNVAADDPELEAASETLCAAFVAGLARQGRVRVTACESAQVALAAGLDDSSLARLLAVDNLVAGSARRLPDGRIQVDLAMHEVSSGRRRWALAGSYALHELQALPTQLTHRTSDSLGLLPVAAGSAAEASRIDASSYQTYLKALQLGARGAPEDMRAALALVDEVLAAAPGYMPARVWQLALRGHALRFATAAERERPEVQAQAQARLMQDSEQLGRELLAADGEDPRAHMMLANLAVQQRRWLDAMAHIDAIESAPQRVSQPLLTAAHLLAMGGYVARAQGLALEAARLDPLNAIPHQGLALFHGLLADDAAMRESARIAQELGAGMAVVYQGIAALREGNWPEAETATVEGLRGAGVEAGWVAGFVRAAANQANQANQTDPAERAAAVREIEALPEALQHGMARFHWYLGWLGDTPATLRAVQANLRRPLGIWLSNLWWPELAHLRQDPRFAEVLADARLPELWRVRGAPDLCEAVPGEPTWRCR